MNRSTNQLKQNKLDNLLKPNEYVHAYTVNYILTCYIIEKFTQTCKEDL